MSATMRLATFDGKSDSLVDQCPTHSSTTIINSPYERPSRHWDRDGGGQATQQVLEARRLAKFYTPIPKPKKNFFRPRSTPTR
jgi:hypothetical protein